MSDAYMENGTEDFTDFSEFEDIKSERKRKKLLKTMQKRFDVIAFHFWELQNDFRKLKSLDEK